MRAVALEELESAPEQQRRCKNEQAEKDRKLGRERPEARRRSIGARLAKLLRMPAVMRRHGRGRSIGIRTGDDRHRTVLERGHEARRSEQADGEQQR